MRIILLSRNKIAFVDDIDYERLAQFNWSAVEVKKKSNTTYAQRREYLGWTNGAFRGRVIKMHRLIMGIDDPNIIVHHIDGNGLNNTRANLLPCTQIENSRSRPNQPRTDKYYGVFKTRRIRKPFFTRIIVNKKLIHLGCFATDIEAAVVYDNAAREHHKEFATLNFPD